MKLVNFTTPYTDNTISYTEAEMFSFMELPLFRQVKFPRSNKRRIQEKWGKRLSNYEVAIPDLSGYTWSFVEVSDISEDEYPQILEIFEEVLNEKR